MISLNRSMFDCMKQTSTAHVVERQWYSCCWLFIIHRFKLSPATVEIPGRSWDCWKLHIQILIMILLVQKMKKNKVGRIIIIITLIHKLLTKNLAKAIAFLRDLPTQVGSRMVMRCRALLLALERRAFQVTWVRSNKLMLLPLNPLNSTAIYSKY